MSTIWPDTGTSACLGPVRSEPVRNGFSNMMTPLNLEPDRRSGSAQGMNLEPNHGPVRLGSGSDHGSEPNLTTPIQGKSQGVRCARHVKRENYGMMNRSRIPTRTFKSIVQDIDIMLVRYGPPSGEPHL